MRTSPILVLSAVLVLLAGSATADAGPASAWIGCGTQCPARIPDHNGTDNGVLDLSFDVPTGVCGDSVVTRYAVYLDAMHGHVGDLALALTSPASLTVTLLVPDAAGCSGDDIGAKFEDDRPAAACNATIPAIRGATASASPLSALDTTTPAGTWHLTLRDTSHGGDGQVMSAALVMDCRVDDGIFIDSFEFD